MKNEWKEYLKRLMKAMNLDEKELEEFDHQIQSDYEIYKKESRIREGEEIINEALNNF